MPAPYSYDLRQKVINAIELYGMSKTKASQFFHLSRNTINLWLQRKAQTGDFLPKPNRPPGNNHKITDWHKFKAFAQEHGDKTSAQMAQLWDDDISPRTISRTLKKIGFTRKQLTATKNVISNSERSLLLRLNIWSRKGWFTSMKLA
ncbi:putative transposase [Limnospira platensis NIES-39]|nr:putative transposase [Arthrospira platensis NIES-39]BDT12582.1 putative transposase [Arthrospira platensis NIES-39]